MTIKNKKILVTGGAGYIGSHVVHALIERGCQVVVVDNMSRGLASRLPKTAKLHQIDISNYIELSNLFSSERFDVVMHFAASIEVGESVKHPGKYYYNNFVNTLILLNVMRAHQVNLFIFSSTAAIFGAPEYTPADEKHPKNPINPYGRTKLMCEHMLEDCAAAYGLKFVVLRYFNAAGADPQLRAGFYRDDASHLIPIALRAANREQQSLSIFGSDYPTKDGTCVRDYVHVTDLSSAHLLAAQYLLEGGESRAYNLGNGVGYSVREVILAVEKVTGNSIPVLEVSRRAGDPASLVADSSLIQHELGWRSSFPELETIVQHAWQWKMLK